MDGAENLFLISHDLSVRSIVTEKNTETTTCSALPTQIKNHTRYDCTVVIETVYFETCQQNNFSRVDGCRLTTNDNEVSQEEL